MEIFADFIQTTEIDKNVFWIILDGEDKWCGVQGLPLDTNVDLYLAEHAQEWLDEIHAMNADPERKDWKNVHPGKLKQVLAQIDAISNLTEAKVFFKRLVKYIYKLNYTVVDDQLITLT